MLLKESKIRVLENFYALDYVFFGKPISEVKTCCPLVKEEYLSIKGALMSVYLEMLKLVEHSPNPSAEKVSSKELMIDAKYAATVARNEAEELVTTDKSRQNIKTSIREALNGNEEVDITALVEQKIREKAFALAIDNLLVGRAIVEALNLETLNSWEGEIIEDSYKILRDNLVEAAYQILYEDEAEDVENDENEEDEDENEEEKDKDEEEVAGEGLDFFDSLKYRLTEKAKR